MTNAALAQFGVTGANLSPQAKVGRPRVATKIAHIDGDFISYQIAADTKDETEGRRPLRTLEYKMEQIQDIAMEIMERAGAGKFVLHITPSGSTKGGRADQVVQKEYQANRADREKPEHLDQVRYAIGSGAWQYGHGMVHLIREADDGMTMAAVNDIDNVIICSKDKDLRMAPGWHMDMDTDELVFVRPDEFGTIWLDDTKSSKKLVGWGPKFFWAQCLMGDTVDNIAGLPVMAGCDVERINKPELYRQNVQLKRALKDDPAQPTIQRINSQWAKQGKVGAVAAFNVLKDIDNNKDAFNEVRTLFQNVEDVGHGGYVFRHWKTNQQVTPTNALLGDMLALWMRHTDDPKDVIRWLKQFV
jgi:hypothetical protein